MNKAVGYIRVSTDKDKQANSLAVQPDAIKRYAYMAGLQLVDVVQDEVSALKVPFWKRAGGEIVREMIRRREIQHVIGAKVDRMFRNVIDGLGTADWLKSQNIGLHVIDTGGVLNVSDPAGRMMFSMLLSVAEFEPRRIGQRTSEAMQEMRRSGKKTGAIPLGFKPACTCGIEECLDCQMLVPVPAEQAIIEEIKVRIGAEPMSTIAKDFNTRGISTKNGKHWHASTIRSIMRRMNDCTL